MAINDEIRDEILQYDINRDAEKYQLYHQLKLINMNLTGEEIQSKPSNQSQIIEQAKITYSPLGKTLEKQIQKQVDALKT